MKIAVFSDIHGNEEALDAILEKIKEGNYKEVIYLGDAVGIGPSSKECLKKLVDFGVKFLAGNHEMYCLKGASIDKDLENEKLVHHLYVKNLVREEINKLEYSLRYDMFLKNKKFSFFHFFLTNEEYPYEHLDILNNSDIFVPIFKKENADYIFFGHNHEKHIYEINGKMYYGVGSSGCTKNEYTYFYEIDYENEIQINKKIVEYDRKKFEEKINKLNYPNINNIKKIFFGIE